MLITSPNAADRANMAYAVPIITPLIEYGACEAMNSIKPIPNNAPDIDLKTHDIAIHS